MTCTCTDTRLSRFRDVEPNLPDVITQEEIRQKCDAMWQQPAAVRPPDEGGPTPTPVAPVGVPVYKLPEGAPE
jgi:hypothetical protein